MAQKTNGNGIPADLESKLWAAADKLRGHMDAAEYKNMVLGLTFLKYISDAFQALYDRSEPSRGLGEVVTLLIPEKPNYVIAFERRSMKTRCGKATTRRNSNVETEPN